MATPKANPAPAPFPRRRVTEEAALSEFDALADEVDVVVELDPDPEDEGNERETLGEETSQKDCAKASELPISSAHCCCAQK